MTPKRPKPRVPWLTDEGRQDWEIADDYYMELRKTKDDLDSLRFVLGLSLFANAVLGLGFVLLAVTA